MAKRNLSEITIEPINSTSSRTTVPKDLGAWARFGGCRTATGGMGDGEWGKSELLGQAVVCTYGKTRATD